MTVGQRIQIRRDTAANWTSANPVLLAGEPGLETDTGNLKLGDGASGWVSLPYADSTVFVPKVSNTQTVGGTLVSSQLAGEILPRLKVTGEGQINMADPPQTLTLVTGTSTLTFTTSGNHSYAVGDPVTVSGVLGITGVNGTWAVATVADATHFTATGASASGSYTSGGTVQRVWGGQGITNEGHWNLILNTTSKVGLSIRGIRGGAANLFSIVDYTNSPVFVIPVAGGPAVLGDNLRVFAGGNVFDPIVKLRNDGTVQMAQGDVAGGAGVIALGNVTTAPTGVPDGSHTLDGSLTKAGGVLYSNNGQLYYLDTDGHTFAPEMPGTLRSHQRVTKDAGATTLSSVGTPAVSTLGSLANSDDPITGQWLGLQTGAVSGNNAAVKAASFSQLRAAWASVFWCRIQTDPVNITSSRIWVGLFSADPSGTATPSQAIGFRYDTGVDGTAFWRTYCQDGSTATTTTTTQAIAANTRYDLRIIVNAAYTQVRYLINEVTVATHSTHLPTFSQALGPAVYVTTLTSAARNLLFSRWALSFNG